MIIATSGHVDHGKTSLVQALTGIDTDSLKQEKARGLTIDLGFAHMNQGDQTIGFVDVPGHIRFINNMLAGVSGIDFGMLVIAADDGPMPQTEEHLRILALLGVTRGCIVITKIDRVSSTRLDTLQQEIDSLTLNTPFQDLPRLSVSSITGTGLPELTHFLWQAAAQFSGRSDQGFFRMAIDRAFSIKGSGLVVTGSVRSGRINLGDELILHPQGTKVKVRGIQIQNQTAKSGQIGDRCAINLTGSISRDAISRGNWLAANSQLPLTRVVDVICHVSRPIKHWTPVHIHAAAQHVTGRLATLESNLINPGQTGLAQLILDEAINVCSFDKLIIRDQAAEHTLGGCTVLNPFANLKARNKPENVALLEAINLTEAPERIGQMLLAKPGGLLVSQLAAMFNTTIELPINGVIQDDQYLFHTEHIENSCNLIVSALKASDAPVTSVSLLNQCKISRPLGLCALSQLLKQDQVRLKDGLYQLATVEIKLNGPEQSLWQKVEPILRQDLLKPPVLHDLAKQVNLPVKAVEKLLSNCIPFKLILRPVKNRFFLPEAIDQLKQAAISLSRESDSGQFTVIEFRDKVGIGRNLCIELLEYFDNTGFTKRLGDQRIIQNTKR